LKSAVHSLSEAGTLQFLLIVGILLLFEGNRAQIKLYFKFLLFYSIIQM